MDAKLWDERNIDMLAYDILKSYCLHSLMDDLKEKYNALLDLKNKREIESEREQVIRKIHEIISYLFGQVFMFFCPTEDGCRPNITNFLASVQVKLSSTPYTKLSMIRKDEMLHDFLLEKLPDNYRTHAIIHYTTREV